MVSSVCIGVAETPVSSNGAEGDINIIRRGELILDCGRALCRWGDYTAVSVWHNEVRKHHGSMRQNCYYLAAAQQCHGALISQLDSVMQNSSMDSAEESFASAKQIHTRTILSLGATVSSMTITNSAVASALLPYMANMLPDHTCGHHGPLQQTRNFWSSRLVFGSVCLIVTALKTHNTGFTSDAPPLYVSARLKLASRSKGPYRPLTSAECVIIVLLPMNGSELVCMCRRCGLPQVWPETSLILHMEAGLPLAPCEGQGSILASA